MLSTRHARITAMRRYIVFQFNKTTEQNNMFIDLIRYRVSSYIHHLHTCIRKRGNTEKQNNRKNIFKIAHLNTFVQSCDIASEALNNFKKIHYMY